MWQGGLGVWGGDRRSASLVGAWVVKRSGNSVTLFMDAVAPGLLLAQAIGRWGNWWNQELYGKHTTLPWALEIHGKARREPLPPDLPLRVHLGHRSACSLLLWIDRRFTIRRPGLFALYVSYYTFGRMFEELLRTDPSSHVFGLRLNFWVSLVCFLVSSLVLRLLAVPAGPGEAGAVSPVPPREGSADPEAGTEDGRAQGARPVGRLRSLP